MKKNSTRTICAAAMAILFLALSISVHAQYTTKIIAANAWASAIARDNSGNIYVMEAISHTSSSNAQILKYTNGTGTPTVIYSGTLIIDVIPGIIDDYAFGLAVTSNGDVYATIASDYSNSIYGSIIKLTYNSGTNTYAASTFKTGNANNGTFASLAVDASNNLYCVEYNAAANGGALTGGIPGAFEVVKYPAVGGVPSTSGATVLYDKLELTAFASSNTYKAITGLAVDNATGNIFVGDSFNNGVLPSPDGGHVYKLTKSGSTYTPSIFSTNTFTTALNMDAAGNLYALTGNANNANYTLVEYVGATGAPVTLVPTGTFYGAGGWYPEGLIAINSTNIFTSNGGQLGDFIQVTGPPTTQATNLNFTNIYTATGTTATVNWTNGNGASRAVFIKQATTGNPTAVTNTTYTANTAITSGSQIGASGWYCIYNGTGSTVNITGLTAGQTYRVMAEEYNGPAGSENYLQTTATNNPNNVTPLASTTINSINRVSAAITNATSVNYTATFAASVSGLSTSNFSLTTTGTISGASVASLTGSGTTYTVTVNTGTGNGDITLNLANNTNLVPAVSSTLPFAGQAYTIDKTAPTITGITRVDATPTNAAAVSFLITLSEAISGGATNNFSLTTSGVTGASMTSISGSGNTRTVLVNTGTGNGTVRLDMVNSTGITDVAGNSVSGLPYTTGLPYTIYKVTTATDYFRTKNTTGNWGTASDWESSADNSMFITATAFPTSTATAITVQNGHVINVSANQSAGNITLAGNIHISAQTLSVSGTISGAGSGKFVKIDNTGSLKLTLGNGITKLFPVGNSTYNPLSITNNSGASDDFTVKVLDEVYNGSGGVVIGAHVQRTWDITKTNANAGSGVDLTFNWNSAENGGVVTPKMYHYQGGAWVKQTGTTSSTANSLTYTGYTGTFSPFAIGDDAVPLPLNLLSFNAALQDKQVLLNWQTAEERNTDHFVLERSIDAKNYKAIGVVKANGSMAEINRYAYTDMLTDDLLYANKMMYYRLQLVDVNGEATYSPTVAVSLSAKLGSAPDCFPNPAKSQLYLTNLNYKALTLRSSTGARVCRTDHPVSNIDVSSLAGGIYYLQIELLDGSSVWKKVIKE
jgi:hypothetical protein